MNAIVINSLDEALQYVTDEKTDWSAVSVASSLFSFEIKIVGMGMTRVLMAPLPRVS